MTAGTFDITIEQGATYSNIILLKDSNNDPRDLSGVTEIRGQVRKTFTSEPEFPFTLAIVAPASNGEISWIMPATVTATIPGTDNGPAYYYDIEMEFGTGVVERILMGRARISSEVTR